MLSFLWRLLVRDPKRYWCGSCQMECFETKMVRYPIRHRVGLCVRCEDWRPVQVTHV